MAFIPNLTCTVTRMNGGYNDYGEAIPGISFSSKCAIVKLKTSEQKTSVRVDTAGSKGNAEERVIDSMVLFKPNVVINIGDVVTVAGISIQIVSKFPRHDIFGKLDHYEYEGSIWVGYGS